MDGLIPVAQLPDALARQVVGVFTDIDDTLTWEGRLVPAAFQALADLQRAGLRVVPVTGRPGGWVDHLARQWPVDGVVGENGGLWYWHDGRQLQRRFLQGVDERAENRRRLEALIPALLAGSPGAALASDQPYRELDLAIDYTEDVPPLPPTAVQALVDTFHQAGATAKVSSIHVNGWFGRFDKFVGCCRFVAERYGESLPDQLDRWVYVGDSANDEPMFERFPHAVGVANVAQFLPSMRHHPRYLTPSPGGHGFAELAARLLRGRAAPKP